MTEKQKRFCEFFVGECIGNITQSAKKAGYSENYSYHMAYKLLENVEIKNYIEELSKKDTQSRIASADEIQSFWSDVLKDTEEEMKNRLRASELLAKAKGLFNNDW